jgi:hypothetical protein
MTGAAGEIPEKTRNGSRVTERCTEMFLKKKYQSIPGGD